MSHMSSTIFQIQEMFQSGLTVKEIACKLRLTESFVKSAVEMLA